MVLASNGFKVEYSFKVYFHIKFGSVLMCNKRLKVRNLFMWG